MLPIIVLFWQENGLTMSDIFLLQGAFSISLVLLEIPTGMVADLLGKRRSLIVGNLINISGFVIFSLGSGFYSFLIAEIMLGLGISFLSGADSALLYDMLKEHGEEKDFQRISGKAHSQQMFAFAVCNLAGGLIGEYSLRACVALTGLGPLLSFGIAWMMFEGNQPKGSPRELVERYKELVKSTRKFVFKHKLVRWFMIYIAVLVLGSRWTLWQYQPYFTEVGLPVFTFGFIFASFNLFAAATAAVAYRFSARLNRGTILVMLAVLQSIPMALMSLFAVPAGFLFILGHQAVRGFVRPVLHAWILEFTFSDKRATVLSVSGLISQLVFAACSPFLGMLGERYGLLETLMLETYIIGGILAVLLILYRLIPDKYFTPKPYKELQ